jgi:hypothetical protein
MAGDERVSRDRDGRPGIVESRWRVLRPIGADCVYPLKSHFIRGENRFFPPLRITPVRMTWARERDEEGVAANLPRVS